MALSLDGTTGITSDGGTPVIENLDTTATGIAVTGVLTTTGNVGIGTSLPSQLLEVRGAAARIRITDTDTSGTTGIEFVDSANTVDAEIEVGNSTQYLAIKTAGSYAMRIDSSGNVGIGTSSPASRLHVSNSGAVADNCFNVSTPANDNVLLGANLVVDAAGNYTKPATSISGAGILFQGINQLNAHGSIQFLSAPDDNTGSATPIERMRIDNAGNLQFNSGYGSVATAYGCRAWVNFASGPTIRASGNVSSISQLGGVSWDINFSTALPDVNYTTTGSASDDGISGTALGESGANLSNRTTSKVRVILSAGVTRTNINVAIFR